MKYPAESEIPSDSNTLQEPKRVLDESYPPPPPSSPPTVNEEQSSVTQSRRASSQSVGSLKSKYASMSSLRHRRLHHRMDSLHPSIVSSGTSYIDKEYGNWVHRKNKDSRYFYEEKTKRYDPFFEIEVATNCETYFVGQKARTMMRETEHFAYIVDLDNYEYHKVVFHSFLNDILQSPFFRHGILILVLVNAVLIGLATIPNFQKFYIVFELLDMIILSVFIFEVIIKWIYDFRLFWATTWNILDFSIISLTVLAAVVPLGENRDAAAIFVKVVRACRSLRCVSSMTSLGIVSHTVIKSGLDMGNILLVLLIIMLVLSVMAVILFDIEGLQPQRFLNALDAWFVLFICVTQDGWAQVLNSYERQSRYFVIIALYLIFSVSLGAFVFANLIVAVIVANLELSVKELREELKLRDNPLEFNATFDNVAEVEIIPVYDLLSKNNFVCISQRPLRIPKMKKASARKVQAYISRKLLFCFSTFENLRSFKPEISLMDIEVYYIDLFITYTHTFTVVIVALEQNMLEAEIICLDLEKIMAVLLSIIVQLDVNTGKIAKKEREAALKSLATLIASRSKRELTSRLKAAAAKAEIIGRLTKQKDTQTSQSTSKSHTHVKFSGKDEQKII